MRCAAVVTAGGMGKRMGSAVPKQLLMLGGVPILARTLLVFQNHPLIESIVLTVPADHELQFREQIVRAFGLAKVSRIVTGGETRQASVFNGLHAVEGAEITAIHDGVRPLVSPEIITLTIEVAAEVGAVVACVPVLETVKRRTDSLLETIPRSDLWLAHTPQTFRTSLILRAHDKAVEEGFVGTDDAALVERMGLPVAVVPDSPDNIKITTPEDLVRAARLLGIPVQGGETKGASGQ